MGRFSTVYVEMAEVTLDLLLMNGRRHSITVPKDIGIQELEDTIATQLGHPISGLTHNGRRLEKGAKLSDRLRLEMPFYVLPYQPSGAQPSIVSMSNANRQSRANRLEKHIVNRRNPMSKGAMMKNRSLGGRRKKSRRASRKSRKTRQTRRR